MKRPKGLSQQDEAAPRSLFYATRDMNEEKGEGHYMKKMMALKLNGYLLCDASRMGLRMLGGVGTTPFLSFPLRVSLWIEEVAASSLSSRSEFET